MSPRFYKVKYFLDKLSLELCGPPDDLHELSTWIFFGQGQVVAINR